MNDKMSTVFISAGEPSGDLHAAELVLSLKKASSDINYIGNGGDKMAKAGVKICNHINQMSVMGFTEVLKKLPSLFGILDSTVTSILSCKPDRLILVDYPGFNLRLVKKIKHLGIPITYFILPQTWAWKENRIYFMKKHINEFISIFPFEADWYNSKGLKTQYLGHPFIEKTYEKNDKNNFYKKHDLKKNKPLLILLPGSRQQEIDYHWPVFLKTISLIINETPDIQFLVVKSDNIKISYIPDFIKIERHASSALKYGSAAISSSGTVTLECALAALPIIVCYKTSFINYALFNFFGNINFISIVNLIAEKKIVPELIQSNMNPKKLFNNIMPFINRNSKKRNTVLENYNILRQKLGPDGVFDRIANTIINSLNR
jgi:lipid-A-disaccharide synthase|tara:strand:- start:1164 stop:2288 length:1125 start_codon:yes stop_codon:yes gene_type:complete